MYCCDVNSYYAGKIEQYVADNLGKGDKIRYGLHYDHKNGWADNQDVYDLEAILEIVTTRLNHFLGREVCVSCKYVPFGWQIIVELEDRNEL